MFDSVDLDADVDTPDPQAYNLQDYIPKVDHGAVLVTSRLWQFDDLGGHLSLKQLDMH